jgi:urea transport system ATP-binding protein
MLPMHRIQPSIIKDIGRVIRMLRQRGDMAIVLCEQYFDFAHELSDRFVVLSRGEVVARGDQAQMGSDHVRQLLSV